MLNIWHRFLRAYRREKQLAEVEMWLNPIYPRVQYPPTAVSSVCTYKQTNTITKLVNNSRLFYYVISLRNSQREEGFKHPAIKIPLFTTFTETVVKFSPRYQ